MISYYLSQLNSSHELNYIFFRALIVYIYAIILLRVGNRRFHFETAFDFILIIIIGSTLARSINGNSTLLAGLMGSAGLILLHWIFAVSAFHSHVFGMLIKGKAKLLIKNGEIDWDALRQTQVTEKDLREMCRQLLNRNDLSMIKEARLERTGRVSFITKKLSE